LPTIGLKKLTIEAGRVGEGESSGKKERRKKQSSGFTAI
jgi:hypothetical protein